MYSRFTFVENTISNSPKVLRVKFQGSDTFFLLSVCASRDYFRKIIRVAIAAQMIFLCGAECLGPNIL